MLYLRLPGGLPARSWQANRDVTDYLSTNDTDGSQIGTNVISTDDTDFALIISGYLCFYLRKFVEKSLVK